MRTIDAGVVNPAEPGTRRAVAKAPGLAVLHTGELLATYRVGLASDTEQSTVEIRRSNDLGHTWSPPVELTPARVDVANALIDTHEAHRGGHYAANISVLGSAHLLLVSLWVDRDSRPGQPLFNPDTEGCLPMAILLADSFDDGQTWSHWRVVSMPAEIGPPSLTSPILVLPSGRLALSIESNKPYLDRSRWYQRVVWLYSDDRGRTWGAPRTVAADPTGRIFNWDQRVGVVPDGRIATFSWTFDHDANRYLNIHRRISADEGLSWSEPEDLGISDQASHPAVLPDGRVVLAWVDRFGDQSIKARLADRIDAPFRVDSELLLYARPRDHGGPTIGADPGETLDEMGRWTFGQPFAEVLPNGKIMVLYYAGTPGAIDIRWAVLEG